MSLLDFPVIVKTPGILLNWMYEIFHTFFVVTGQIVAYFGMIFWLFLFLFTFFVIEKQESYFEERRKFRQDLLKKILLVLGCSQCEIFMDNEYLLWTIGLLNLQKMTKKDSHWN